MENIKRCDGYCKIDGMHGAHKRMTNQYSADFSWLIWIFEEADATEKHRNRRYRNQTEQNKCIHATSAQLSVLIRFQRPGHWNGWEFPVSEPLYWDYSRKSAEHVILNKIVAANMVSHHNWITTNQTIIFQFFCSLFFMANIPRWHQLRQANRDKANEIKTKKKVCKATHWPAIRRTARSAGSNCSILNGLSFAHSLKLSRSIIMLNFGLFLLLCVWEWMY